MLLYMTNVEVAMATLTRIDSDARPFHLNLFYEGRCHVSGLNLFRLWMSATNERPSFLT